MAFINYTIFHNVVLLLCIGCVQNKIKHLKTNSAVDISDLNSLIYLDSMQLIRKYSYISERHSVITEDGYILNLFRIPRKGPPVLLVHGIGDSSDSWLVLGPKKSIAYLLANAGFDVWLYNSRGNKYSKGHASNLSSKAYWNFSYEEMGTQDLPATIDYILRTTSRTKLTYIGFSQGTTIFFVMCSMRPEYNDKIKHAILLAPVAWVSDLQYPFIDILTPNLKDLVSLSENIGLYELFPNNLLANLYHSIVCNASHPAKVLCDLEFYISYGMRNTTNIAPDKLPVVASHITAGSSTKTFVHFMQGYASKRFQRYSYYKRGQNEVMYGSSLPPEYDLASVRPPLSLYASESDWFSTSADLKTLRKKLQNIKNYVVFNRSLNFTHIEFVYGSRVGTLVNDPVVSLLTMLNK